MTEAPIATMPPQNPEDEQASTPVDYFSFHIEEQHYLPDGVQWVKFVAMNEGAKKKYQAQTSTDFVVDRRSGDTKVRMNPGVEREILLRESITDWYILRGGQPVPFNQVQLGDFLTLADPRIVEGIEKAIREVNPWLLDNFTVEDIDKQIDELKETRARLVEREAGEGR